MKRTFGEIRFIFLIELYVAICYRIKCMASHASSAERPGAFSP